MQEQSPLDINLQVEQIFSKYNILFSSIDTSIKLNQNSSLIAFDYGTKRIGAAGGNFITKQAFAIDIIHYETRLQRFQYLQKIVHEWQPQCIIIGLPMHADGTAHTLTRASCNFGLDMNRYFKLPIIWVDERYTTTTIQHKKIKQYIDDKSAMLIMQQFLDSCHLNNYFILA